MKVVITFLVVLTCFTSNIYGSASHKVKIAHLIKELEGTHEDFIATDVMSSAMEKLARIGEPAIPYLVAALKEKRTTYGAYFALSKIGGAAAPVLVETIASENSLQCLSAKNLLTDFGESSVPYLVQALEDENKWVAASKVLGKIGKPAIPLLTKALENKTLKVRANLALVDIREPKAKATRSGDRYVGEWKDNKRHGKGTYYYKSGSIYKGEYKANKKDGLGLFKYASGDIYEGEYKEGKMHGMGVYYFAESGKTWQGEWRNGVQHKGTYIQSFVFSENTFLDDDVTIQRLIKELEHKDSSVSQAAYLALAEIGEPALPSLFKALKNDNTQITAHLALVKIGKPAIPGLLDALENRKTSAVAYLSLSEIGEPAIPGLINALANRKASTSAFLALSEIGEQAIPSLMNALEDDERWVAASRALGKIGEPAVPYLTKAAGNSTLKIRANLALVDIREPTAKATKSGDRYVGEWKDNKRHGKGTYYFKSGSIYKGSYKANKKDGLGLFKYASGDIYEGEYKEGERHGTGTYYYAKSDKTWQGEWRNGKQYKGSYIEESFNVASNSSEANKKEKKRNKTPAKSQKDNQKNKQSTVANVSKSKAPAEPEPKKELVALLEKKYKDSPDETTLLTLVDHYVSAHQFGQASTSLKEAIKKHPDFKKCTQKLVEVEQTALRQDLNFLVEIGSGTPQQRTKYDRDLKYDAVTFNAQNIQEGFVANHSSTLSLDLEILIEFEITTTTTVTMFLLPVSETSIKKKEFRDTMWGLKPGEFRPFQAVINTSGLDLGGVGSSQSEVTQVRVIVNLLNSDIHG